MGRSNKEPGLAGTQDCGRSSLPALQSAPGAAVSGLQDAVSLVAAEALLGTKATPYPGKDHPSPSGQGPWLDWAVQSLLLGPVCTGWAGQVGALDSRAPRAGLCQIAQGTQ